MNELPENVLWLEDGANSRYVNKYECRAYEENEVATFFDYDQEGGIDYDTAVTCRVVNDDLLGLVARLV